MHPRLPCQQALSTKVQRGISVNLDDRDFNSFSLNPSCSSDLLIKTWIKRRRTHGIDPRDKAAFFSDGLGPLIWGNSTFSNIHNRTWATCLKVDAFFGLFKELSSWTANVWEGKTFWNLWTWTILDSQVVHHVQPETMRCMWELDNAEEAQGISSSNSVTQQLQGIQRHRSLPRRL